MRPILNSVLNIAVLSLMLAPVAAHAQESADVATPQDAKTFLNDSVKDDYAERLELSRELHDVKDVRNIIRRSIDGMSLGLPEHQREDFKKYVELHVDFDALEQKSIKDAADIYTVPELKAMIAYFGSNAGRSAEAKSEQYAAQFGPEVQKQIDKALMAAKFDKVGGQSLPGSGPVPTKEMLGR